MPARVYWADPEKGSVSSTILRINRERGRIVGTVQLPDGQIGVVTVDDNPPCEVRVEQPDTRGGASRPIDSQVINDAVNRHWPDGDA